MLGFRLPVCQTCFLLLLVASNIHGLFYFKRLELEHQAKLALKEKSESDLWIEQKLDNFHPQDTRKWMQRYFIQTSYEKENGPVFLQIGGEGPASPVWMENGHWIDMAKQFGALCFMLEHRFYGKSHPTIAVRDEDLNYLSSEQALSDVANFISNMTEKHKLDGRKWIVIGGSYSGALAVWARLKYPHLVSGSVSASAPLDALVNFKGYLDVAHNALQKYGSESCINSIAESTKAVAEQLKTAAGRLYLQNLFDLCEPLDETGFDDANFQQALAGNIMGIVQYNNDSRSFGGSVGGSITIRTVCDTMTDASLGEPIRRYAKFNEIILETYDQKCLDASYSSFIKQMKDSKWSYSVGGRAWTYQTCTEFGWYQSSDSSSQPFIGFPIAFQLDQCKSIFGITPTLVGDDVMQTNEQYGGLSVAGLVSNVTLYNGGVDPWHAVSYVAPQHRHKRRSTRDMTKEFSQEGIVSIFVPDTAHCAPMYPASPNDSPLLVQARLEIERNVAAWLGVSLKLRFH